MICQLIFSIDYHKYFDNKLMMDLNILVFMVVKIMNVYINI